jgi:hypothetical protein
VNGIQITALVPQKAIIPYTDFPQLLKAHLARNKNTQSLEASGLALRTASTINWPDLDAFIRQVCTWGDYSGIAGRVLKRNSKTLVKTSIEGAIKKLSSTPPNVVAALESITLLRDLASRSGQSICGFCFLNTAASWIRFSPTDCLLR